jgi:K+-sensing histidine kinase KdpD
MHVVERIPQLEVRPGVQWQKIALDSLLAVGGVAIITGIIVSLQLYPRVPNISDIYLLLILPLATWRGRYAAILSAIAAFLIFDFFQVPPRYSFNMTPSGGVALVIFLFTAVITSQLAAIMQQRAQQAWRRERESRILYEMMHLVNSKITFDEQLDMLALSIVRVFAPWGVRECALLLPDKNRQLVIKADAPIQIESFTLSPEQMTAAGLVMSEGKGRTLAAAIASSGDPALLYLLPLQVNGRSLGVLAFHMQSSVMWLANLERIHNGLEGADDQGAFFWTVLDQVASTIERGRLRLAMSHF